jgi:hypothetical protein
MDDPTQRPEGAWPADRPIRWRGLASSLTRFLTTTIAGVLQLALAVPLLVIANAIPPDGVGGLVRVALALAWAGLTLFAAWSWLVARWRVVLAPLATIALLGTAWIVFIGGRGSDAASFGSPAWDGNPAAIRPGVAYAPSIDPGEFTTTITNRYLPLVPGTVLTYEGGRERIVLTVTERTRAVMGVTALVVRDRASVDGALVEDTEDWFAQDAAGHVWYFGEDTAECRGGAIANRHGAWEAGVDGALPGIVMLAEPQVGAVYRQEFYRGQAEDVGRVLRLDEAVDRAGEPHRDVLVVEDSSPLEPGRVEHKLYAPEVGLVEERTSGGTVTLGLVRVESASDAAASAAGPLCSG